MAMLLYPNATIYIHGIDGHVGDNEYYFDKEKGSNNSPVLQQLVYLNKLIVGNKIKIL